MSDSQIRTVFKNIAPAVVVMVAGLLGAFMVYDSYFTNTNVAGQYSQIAPAAGDHAGHEGHGEAAHEGHEATVEGDVSVTAVNCDDLGENPDQVLVDACAAAAAAEEAPVADEAVEDVVEEAAEETVE